MGGYLQRLQACSFVCNQSYDEAVDTFFVSFIDTSIILEVSEVRAHNTHLTKISNLNIDTNSGRNPIFMYV